MAIKNHKTVLMGVTGGKGGTGKSTVATALAYALAKTNKVLLVDADVGCPNDHLLLNIDRILLKKVTQRIPEWDLSKCKQCGFSLNADLNASRNIRQNYLDTICHPNRDAVNRPNVGNDAIKGSLSN